MTTMVQRLRALPRQRRLGVVALHAERVALAGQLEAIRCVEHLADLTREYEPLEDTATYDGVPPLTFRPTPCFSGFGSPAAMCAEGGAA